VIIPRPTTLIRHPGHFAPGRSVSLDAGPGAEAAAALLAGYLPTAGIGAGDRPAVGGRIRLRLDRPGDTDPSSAGSPSTGAATANAAIANAAIANAPTASAATASALTASEEGYRLDIRPDGIVLRAAHATGLLRGVQTLRQLLPAETGSPRTAPPDAWRWPCLTITDSPRLRWRGVLLDVARHYMPLDFLYQFVDEIALHKLNVLHLHLTDDQGWRVEIDGWPRLTEIGAWRSETMVGPAGSARYDGRRHGGFYTQAQLRALVRHAEQRGVTVVPEIEMPGHARAVLAAYPRLGNQPRQPLPVWTDWGISDDVLGVQDETLDFCREVLAQIVDVFPSRYIHIGGDECPTSQWEASPRARRRAAELGLAGPARLHGWFLGQMRDFLAARGRRAVCWDEDGGDLPPDVVLTAWRDPAHGTRAIARGHQVIMAPYRWTFLDYAQSDHPDEPPGQPGHLLTLDDVYRYDPLAGLPPASGDGPGVLGTQAQIWTEFVATPAHVRHLAFPRLCALAESAWSGVPGDLADFRDRLARHLPGLLRGADPAPPGPRGAGADGASRSSPATRRST
jgi:hexosaminidase